MTTMTIYACTPIIVIIRDEMALIDHTKQTIQTNIIYISINIIIYFILYIYMNGYEYDMVEKAKTPKR